MKLLFLAILLAQGAGERVINGVVVDAEGKVSADADCFRRVRRSRLIGTR